MVACYIIIGFAAILMVLYIIAKSQKYDLKELFLKIAISFLFIVVALVGTYYSNKFTVFNLLIILGLFLGLLGDIFLDLKYVDLERTEGYSYSGFIVFGVGHILFISALIYNYYQKGNALYLVLPIIISLVLASATILLEKPLKLEYGKYKLISFIYAIFLFGSLAFSFMLAILNEFKILSLNLFFIGSILFVLSDLVLSGTFFGKDKEKPIYFVFNYLFYYGAQFIIALTLLYA